MGGELGREGGSPGSHLLSDSQVLACVHGLWQRAHRSQTQQSWAGITNLPHTSRSSSLDHFCLCKMEPIGVKQGNVWLCEAMVRLRHMSECVQGKDILEKVN